MIRNFHSNWLLLNCAFTQQPTMDYSMSNVLLLPGNQTFADVRTVPFWVGSLTQRSEEGEQTDTRLPMLTERLSFPETVTPGPAARSRVSFDIDEEQSARIRPAAKRRTSNSSKKTNGSRRKSVVEVKPIEPEHVPGLIEVRHT